MEQHLALDEKQIERSLDRLSYFLNQADASPCIPALMYSADLLQKHAKTHGVDKVNPSYFRQFKRELDHFANKDLSQLRKPQQEIIQQALSITNSNLFLQCLRPDIHATRKTHSLDVYPTKSAQLTTDNVLMASEKYRFSIPNDVIKQGMDIARKVQSSKQNINNSESYLGFLPQQSNMSKKENEPNNKAILAQLEEWKQIETSYTEHRLDQAHERLKVFKKKADLTLLSKEKTKMMENIEMEYDVMINFYQQFDQSGWIFDKEENGVRLQYKMYEKEKQIAIKIEGQFNVPVENFLAIVCQVDLMGEYVPFCYDARLVKCISRNQRIGTSKIYIPMLTDRQTYFYATGYDRLAVTNSIFFYSKTVNEDKENQKRYGYQVPAKSDYVRLQYKFFIIEYFPISKTRARVRLASNVDLKLNFLPNFILSVSARRFAFDYFKNIIKISENFKGSAWEKEIQKKPQFYNFFKRKNQDYLHKGKIK